MKLLIGLIVAFVIGGACRWFNIPAPAPPALQGALLVVAMTSGYMIADNYKKVSQATPTPVLSVPEKNAPSDTSPVPITGTGPDNGE